MKKILSFFALVALLLTASCSKQESPVLGEDQVIISLGLEGVSATRAISDGSLVDKLVYEVYDRNGALLGTMDKTETVTFPYSLSLPLAKGQDYTILFWAQDSDCQAYNTDNLKNVTVNYSNAANNDETRDAFYAAVDVRVTGGPQKVEVVLNRPFAQVNVAVPQAEWQRAIDAGVNVSQSSVVFTQEVAKKIDLSTGNVSEYASVQYTAEAIPTEKLTVNNEDYVYLSMSYILVGEQKSMVNNATFTFNSNVNAVTLSVPNLPVQRNYRTNVLGTFLVDYVDFNIVVDPIYNTPDEVYPDTDIENLQYAAKNGGEVTLTGNVQLTDPIIVKKNMIVNLNGKNITAALFAESNGSISQGDTDSYAFWVQDGGNLTINGNGNIITQSCQYSIAVWAQGGNVTINGGHYENPGRGSDLIYASAAGNIVINGGEFKAYPKQPGSVGTNEEYSALNLKDNTGSSITVYGGKFYKFNPADNQSENPKVSFVADGYKVITNNEWYVVVPNEIDAVVTTNEQLKVALEASNKEVYVVKGNYTFPTSSIKEGQTIICEEGTVFEGNSKLNINGAKVVNGTFSNPTGTAVDQTINGVFENCTFTGSNALRYCYAGEKVEFINCVFDGGVYGVHFDGGANKVIFKNCVLSGFNAFAAAITSLTFDNCIFKSNGRNGYNGANLWCGATMSNCEFTFDGSTTNEWIDCIKVDGTYKFDNCTIDGNNYTSSNYADYEQIFSRNHATVTINGVGCQL